MDFDTIKCMRHRFKLLLAHILVPVMPNAYGLFHTIRSKTRRKLAPIKQAIIERHGLTVLSGPFAGMTYVPFAVDSSFVPRIVGSYESELHYILERIIEAGYREIVNIGCGEGYYAIGLALRLPGTRVHAFDIDPWARYLCYQMARINEVTDRVTVSGRCDIKRLRTLPLERALLICDCEGCELDLLRPDLFADLHVCDLLVELHDFLNPKISRTILARFSDTHNITLVNSTERNPVDYPPLKSFKSREQRLALDEFRPGAMQWAFMTSRIRK